MELPDDEDARFILTVEGVIPAIDRALKTADGESYGPLLAAKWEIEHLLAENARLTRHSTSVDK